MAASVLMVAVAPLVACAAPPTSAVRASEPAPIPTTPSGSVSPSPSDVPTPTPTWPPQVALPTPPPEMSRADEAGAIAAASYYMTDLYVYTEMSQDTTRWRAMSHRDCVFCASILKDIAALQSEGQFTIVAPIRVSRISAQALSPAVFSVTIDMTTGPDEDFTKGGGSLGRTTEDSGTATVIVIRQGTEWITRGVDLTRRR
ncbi:MAG: hypothetical protein J0I40_00905 [Cellulomonas sp.]|uniref:DUF6318 family protein n=1 Tax=Cellulomonas sp. 73-92 TaxID=1895740 RepID=UPI001AD3FB05|nr:DUF6318 family protein [Cellulomonas sp. 73-92]MBN9373956.1 hypothetical protein [Cellulomonas sp.]